MKVIFLDIDGVMNSELFYTIRHKKRWLKLKTYYWWIKFKILYILNGFKPHTISLRSIMDEKPKPFKYLFNRLKEETDPIKWKWLSELCNDNDYKICISSVWKHHFHITDDWEKALVKLGFKPNTFVGITGSRKTLRGDEIKNWLTLKENVDDYAILDDDSDMLPEQMSSFFNIDGYYGISTYTMYRIKRHFNKEDL